MLKMQSMSNLFEENIFIKFKYNIPIISNISKEDLKLITLSMEMKPCLTIKRFKKCEKDRARETEVERRVKIKLFIVFTV